MELLEWMGCLKYIFHNANWPLAVDFHLQFLTEAWSTSADNCSQVQIPWIIYLHYLSNFFLLQVTRGANLQFQIRNATIGPIDAKNLQTQWPSLHSLVNQRVVKFFCFFGAAVGLSCSSNLIHMTNLRPGRVRCDEQSRLELNLHYLVGLSLPFDNHNQ